MKKSLKKLMAAVIASAMVLGLMPGMSLTAFAATDAPGEDPVVEYPLYIGGTQVTGGNASDVFSDGTVKYDPESNTLTLNGYSFEGDGNIYYADTEDFVINIQGNNWIWDDSTLGEGIDVDGNLTICGDGSLYVTANISGISTGGSIEITGGELVIGGKLYGIYCYGNVVISGGDIIAVGEEYYGLRGAEVTISGGVVTTAGGNEEGVGIWCGSYDGGGLMTVSGGRVSAQGQYGIYTGGGLTVTGGSVSAEGSEYGISGNELLYTLTIGEGVTSVRASGSEFATDFPIVSAVSGKGWIDAEGTEGETDIAAGAEGEDYAEYKKILFPDTQYTVTFDTNGRGTAPESQTVYQGGAVSMPKDPAAEGFEFDKWYKESECINAWDFITDIVTADTTLYGKWTTHVHNWGEWTEIVPATAWTEGLMKRSCSGCGEDELLKIPVWTFAPLSKVEIGCVMYAMDGDGHVSGFYTGVGQNSSGWWRFENGKVDFEAGGIYQNENGWWKTTNGKVTFDETGIFQNENGWWRVVNSKVDFTANGIYQNANGWWKTTGGKVTFDEDGAFSNENGTWYVKGSKVDFTFSGDAYGYTFVNGKAQ